MSDSPPRHLVSVWNPAYAVDAMDAHVSVLVDRVRAHREGKLPEEEVHVWWGRVRSERRKDPLPHLADVLELDDQIEAEIPTHLYLTDYNSLYVADLARVTVDDVRAQGEKAVPSYYKDLSCDLWFQIWDLRRIVAQDTRGAIQELRRLHNTRYHDHPVSLYGGMVELPLIVWRDSEVDWFGDRDALTEGRLWAERDAEFRHEVARLSADLRDNLFGEWLWNRMEPATRTFIASAEAVVRARREDPTFDFSGPGLEYSKAFETETNAVVLPLLRSALLNVAVPNRLVHLDGRRIDLGSQVPHQSLGSLVRLLREDPIAKKALQTIAPQHVTYLTDEYQLPSHLERVKSFRNPAAHSSHSDREAVLELRRWLLGIGEIGALPSLIRRKERR